VIVALGTTQCQPEEYRSGSVHAVHHGLDAKLLQVNAALLVDGCVAVKAGSDLLVQRGARQQIPGKLFHHELVERQVAVEGMDDPVAVFPDGARRIDAITIGVGITRQVKPVPAPALAIVRRRQQAVDQPLVGVRPVIGDEAIDFLRRRRQAGQIQADPANERDPVRLRRGLDPVFLQPCQDKTVDGRACPGLIANYRQRRPHRCSEGPVFRTCRG